MRDVVIVPSQKVAVVKSTVAILLISKATVTLSGCPFTLMLNQRMAHMIIHAKPRGPIAHLAMPGIQNRLIRDSVEM